MLPIGAKFKVIHTSEDSVFVKGETWAIVGNHSKDRYYLQWICSKGIKVTRPASKYLIFNYFEPESDLVKVLYEYTDK